MSGGGEGESTPGAHVCIFLDVVLCVSVCVCVNDIRATEGERMGEGRNVDSLINHGGDGAVS